MARAKKSAEKLKKSLFGWQSKSWICSGQRWRRVSSGNLVKTKKDFPKSWHNVGPPGAGLRKVSTQSESCSSSCAHSTLFDLVRPSFAGKVSFCFLCGESSVQLCHFLVPWLVFTRPDTGQRHRSYLRCRSLEGQHSTEGEEGCIPLPVCVRACVRASLSLAQKKSQITRALGETKA